MFKNREEVLEEIKKNDEEYNRLLKIGTKLAITSGILLTSVVSMAAYQESNKAYEVRVEDEVVAVVKRKKDVDKALEEIKSEGTKKYEKNVELEKKLALEEVNIDKKNIRRDEVIFTESKVKDSLDSKLNIVAEGYSLKIGNEKIVVANDEKELNEAIDKVKEEKVKELKNENTVKEYLTEEMSVEKVKDNPVTFARGTGLEEVLKGFRIETKEYVVLENEKTEDILKEYNISLERVKELNEENKDLDLKNLKKDDVLNIEFSKPYVSVTTEDEVNIEEVAKFETEIVLDDTMYENKEYVKTEGKDGIVDKKTKITKVDGKEVSREVLEEKIIEEPINKIIVKGSKKVIRGVGIGEFSKPARGYISSSFGPRWGRFHKGTDIAANTGTPITASDGGVVEFAGYNSGGYGNMVIVNHMNGYKTVYAHADTVDVKVGQIVGNGDKLATVGSTGDSTGPHLHFEIILNGTSLDPELYMK